MGDFGAGIARLITGLFLLVAALLLVIILLLVGFLWSWEVAGSILCSVCLIVSGVVLGRTFYVD